MFKVNGPSHALPRSTAKQVVSKSFLCYLPGGLSITSKSLKIWKPTLGHKLQCQFYSFQAKDTNVICQKLDQQSTQEGPPKLSFWIFKLSFWIFYFNFWEFHLEIIAFFGTIKFYDWCKLCNMHEFFKLSFSVFKKCFHSFFWDH